MKEKKYYTQSEVDDYVRKLITDSEIALSKQSERLEKEKKLNADLSKELEEYKKREKASARMLTIAERKAKYIENLARSRSAMEVERLARLAEKWDEYFNGLTEKYAEVDKKKLDEFKDELSTAITQMMDMGKEFSSPLSTAEKSHAEEISRLKVVKEKRSQEMSSRFDKLVQEFNMKIGDSATRGRGRPKKAEAEKIKAKKAAASKNKVYPPKSESGFDFEEALNPVDSLESIMNDLLGDLDKK